MGCHLQGMSVLVTRPANQAEKLCELIEQAHGRPIRFPAMEIRDTNQPGLAKAQLGKAEQADLLIFISTNAVEHAFPLLPDELPLDIEIAAVGKATGKMLAEYGLEPTLIPESRFDSEGLLALEAMQDMQQKSVVLVRGDGGRPLLEQELKRRGAEVVIAEVYRRVLPSRNPSNLIAGWSQMVDVVTVTSNELLDNLFSMLGDEGASLVRKTPLVVISSRMAEHAAALGCKIVYAAANASNQGLLDALCEVAKEQRPTNW